MSSANSKGTMDAYNSKADNQLVNLLHGGDRRAFEEIYRRYASLLFRYVADRIFEREDCEEIVQETFIWVWSKRESLRHVTELRPYLYGIVKHKVYNHIRHNYVHRQFVEHFQKFGMTVDNSNEELANVADIMRILEHAVSQLPERCQMAFKLSRIEHKPIAAIAEQMNISSRTVENYITQALKHLRDACAAFYRSRNE
ncbi:MAG TPA: RNA polymerase sigma-70 factor [Cyclobacteriaceae bacterium]|nr:RNA polymerase sigma-70 factor [Cyclobacteriaceae bacterium]